MHKILNSSVYDKKLMLYILLNEYLCVYKATTTNIFREVFKIHCRCKHMNTKSGVYSDHIAINILLDLDYGKYVQLNRIAGI